MGEAFLAPGRSTGGHEMETSDLEKALVGRLAEPQPERHRSSFQVVVQSGEGVELGFLHNVRGVHPRSKPGFQSKFDDSP